MSHRIVGLDIGSYSVKVLCIESSFRSHQITSFAEELVGAHAPAASGARGERGGDEEPLSPEEAQAEGVRGALAALHHRGLLDGDLVVVGYGLERCVQASTRLPFTQRRQIEQVLPAQIEERLPLDIEELTLEFQVADGPPRSEDGGPPMHRVDVVATPTSDLAAFLARLGELDLDPRIVEAGSARLATAYRFQAEPTPYAGAVAIADVGHRFTDVCIVGDEGIEVLRRLHLGGEDVTRALAEGLGLSWEEAEYRKVAEASIDVSGAAPPAASPQQMEMRRICQAHAALLTDELRRTFQSHLARGGRPVDRMLLCGGGAMLRGLPQFLGAALSLPVDPLAVQGVTGTGPGAPLRAVGALGLAARGLEQRGASRFNLRRGAFSFRGDFEFVRARTRSLALIAGLVVAAFVFMLIMQRSALEARRDAYADALCNATQAVMGECISNPNEVTQRILEGQPPIQLPQHSAYEIFRDISAELVYLREVEVPVEVDRMTVDIQRDVITLRGTTDSAESVDEIVQQLDTLECVDNVASESTQQNRATGLYEFTLRAQNPCL